MNVKKEGLAYIDLEKNLNIINGSIRNIINKHGISFPEIVKVLVEKNIESDNSIKIPSSILKERSLGILEVVTKYLKEHHNLRYNEIASLLNRDARLIWTTYNKVKQKFSEKLEVNEDCTWIPISIFTDRRFGPLEAVCKHLKEKHKLSNCEIADILGRDDRTIWTCYNRIKNKSND